MVWPHWVDPDTCPSPPSARRCRAEDSPTGTFRPHPCSPSTCCTRCSRPGMKHSPVGQGRSAGAQGTKRYQPAGSRTHACGLCCSCCLQRPGATPSALLSTRSALLPPAARRHCSAQPAVRPPRPRMGRSLCRSGPRTRPRRTPGTRSDRRRNSARSCLRRRRERTLPSPSRSRSRTCCTWPGSRSCRPCSRRGTGVRCVCVWGGGGSGVGTVCGALCARPPCRASRAPARLCGRES